MRCRAVPQVFIIKVGRRGYGVSYCATWCEGLYVRIDIIQQYIYWMPISEMQDAPHLSESAGTLPAAGDAGVALLVQ